MGAGRRPKPDRLKVLQGTAEPRNTNPNPPQAGVDALQFIPGELSEKAQKYWAELRPRLVDAGIANNFDKEALMVLCETYATWLEAMEGLRKTKLLIRGANGHPVKSPYFEAANQATKDLRLLLIEFGMTPAARSKVQSSGRKPKKGGTFDDI